MSRGPLRRAWKRLRERLLDRLDLLYTRRFYAKSEGHKGSSEAIVAATLTERFAPRRVIDLGCGSGTFLLGFSRLGVDVFGLERARAGLRICAERGVPARAFDLRFDEPPAEAAGDLALCFEVAEHVRAEFAERLVELCCGLAPVVVFTAAPPGQGGVHHVNEQPPAYWIGRFAARGYHLDAAATESVRAAWAAGGVVEWLVANLLIFVREPSSSTATAC